MATFSDLPGYIQGAVSLIVFQRIAMGTAQRQWSMMKTMPISELRQHPLSKSLGARKVAAIEAILEAAAKTSSPEEFLPLFKAIRGVGPWTIKQFTNYMDMDDSFLCEDYELRRALGGGERIVSIAEARRYGETIPLGSKSDESKRLILIGRHLRK